MIKDLNYTKSTCEKYTLRFNKGMDWAVFTIDDTGIFQCHSSFGDYAYHWTAFGKNFKKFLCGIDKYYLLRKVSNPNYFDCDKYIESMKKLIIRQRKHYDIPKKQARELWSYFTTELEYETSYDLVCYQIMSNSLINDLCYHDTVNSEYMPEKDYSHSAIVFAEEIFPEFIKILKAEVEVVK